MQIHRTIAANAVEPVTLDDLKEYLRVTHSHEDRLLTRLIASSREMCENAARISIVRKNCIVKFTPASISADDFALDVTRNDPDSVAAGATLPFAPVISIARVSLLNRDGSATFYDTDGVGFRADLPFRKVQWIEPCRFHARAVSEITVTYVAGYAEDAVPGPIVDAILETAGAAYTTRADLLSSVPMRAMQLLAPYANPFNMAG